jgi:hypothetical protein
MRLEDALEHPTMHSALTNVLSGDHHRAPYRIAISNTTLVVPPLPGGPSNWDVSVPEDVVGAIVSLRSARTVEMAGGNAGVVVIVTRSSIEASSFSLGGNATLASAAYNAIYTKAASALNLSHKVFSSGGADISLTEAYLTLTGPSTRVLRLTWTNYSAGNRTLDARGEVVLLS